MGQGEEAVIASAHGFPKDSTFDREAVGELIGEEVARPADQVFVEKRAFMEYSCGVTNEDQRIQWVLEEECVDASGFCLWVFVVFLVSVMKSFDD